MRAGVRIRGSVRVMGSVGVRDRCSVRVRIRVRDWIQHFMLLSGHCSHMGTWGL